MCSARVEHVLRRLLLLWVRDFRGETSSNKFLIDPTILEAMIRPVDLPQDFLGV